MAARIVRSDLAVEHEGVVLSGSLWLPDRAPRSAIVMHPGSGPSDRHNDVYFPPIRSLLLDAGHAVASFDKRGVGMSTGSLTTTSIDQQAGDLLACAAAVRAAVPGVPVGAFGHSQGGWVVFEAAARRSGLDFVIANSGPAVSTVVQERYALASTSEALTDAFALLVSLAQEGVDLEVAREAVASARPSAIPLAGLVEDADTWHLARLIFGHDPARALDAIAVQLLALYGAEDAVVPVQASVELLERRVPPELLQVCVLPGGDHRLQRDGELVDGYAAALLGFVDLQCAS